MSCNRYKLTLLEQDKKLSRKFGHHYREVTLRVRGRPEELEDDTRQILTKMLSSWRLSSLTLDIGDREWGNRFVLFLDFFKSFGWDGKSRSSLCSTPNMDYKNLDITEEENL